MYLKSLKINNFRKFSRRNNAIEFVDAKEDLQKHENINIASSTTLIVGKNNSGKTTIIKVLEKLLCSGKCFIANDFNFLYLTQILDLYVNKRFDDFPLLEFEILVGIGDDIQDLVTNVFPFMSIGDTSQNELRIILKYEIKEEAIFKEKAEGMIGKYQNDQNLFNFWC